MKSLILVLIVIVAALLIVSFATIGCTHKAPGKAGQPAIEDKDAPDPAPGKVTIAKTFTGLRWLIFAGVAGLGLSAALCFLNKTWGIAGIISCLVMIFAAVTLNQHLILISWIGLAFGLGLVGLLIWYGYTNRKELLAEARALLEVVTLNEASKPLLPDTVRAQIYGSSDNTDAGLAGKIQATETENRVAAIRHELKPIG